MTDHLSMSFEAFIKPRLRGRQEERDRHFVNEEEEHGLARDEPLFSVTDIVSQRGTACIAASIRLTWDEFQE
jgi:hypothetical protein